MSKITIGMPVYNGADFIEQAIASVEAQTRTDFKVFAADNGSTDGSWEILQAWADRDDRVTLHRHAENIGALGNFRYVLARADTDYFMWQACDDWLSPDYLAALSAILDAAPGCALATAATIRTTLDGSAKSSRPFPDLAGLTRRGRIMAMLRRRDAEWVYGLFRTERLRSVQKDAEDFGHVWSADRLMLLPLVLDDAIRGDSEARFHSRTVGASGPLYAPASLYGWFRFSARFLAFALRIYRDCGLSRTDRLVLFPYFLWHMVRTSHAGFYKYYVKPAFKRSSPG